MALIICAKLPYKNKDDEDIPAEEQAEVMLKFIRNVALGDPEAEIYLTYSANQAQSELLQKHRSQAETQGKLSENELALIKGFNQAKVCFEMALKMGIVEPPPLPVEENPSPDACVSGELFETSQVDSLRSFSLTNDNGGEQSLGAQDNLVAAFRERAASLAANEVSFFHNSAPGSRISLQDSPIDISKKASETRKSYPNIHILPFTTMQYIKKKIYAATEGVLAADIEYFKKINDPSDQHKVIIVWGNQDTNIAIGGGVSISKQSSEDKKLLEKFREELQKKINEDNTFNLLDSADIERVKRVVESTVVDMHHNKRACKTLF